MTEKKDRYWQMLAAALVVLAYACGCGGEEATVDYGGELSSEDGQIAYATNGLGTGPLKDDPYDPSIWVMDADGSDRKQPTDGN